MIVDLFRGRRDDDVDDDDDDDHDSSSDDVKLLHECAAQVQRNLKTHIHTPSVLHTLASYYTRTTPVVYGRPFCVSLSCATFLFHMQMARISVADVELYVQLLVCVLAQLRDDGDSNDDEDSDDDDDRGAMAQLRHPFVQHVLRGYVFGLPTPPPCRHSVHCVVLLPPSQYRGYATLTTTLLARGEAVVPRALTHQFHERLRHYCDAASPLVAHRALALLVQTVPQIHVGEQVRALQYVLRTRPQKMNVDFLLACYARLQRAVPSPAHAPTFARALAIHCSELFLRFHSPVRRAYVEAYLYPSLCHADMRDLLARRATRQHLLRELLAHCAPGMGVNSPYYLCLCALLQPCLNDADETRAALELVSMLGCRMPHAAYFVATLATDVRMSVSMYGKMLLALVRGAGLAMAGGRYPAAVATRHRRRNDRDDDDDGDDDDSSEQQSSDSDDDDVGQRDAVAAVMQRDRTRVYNVLFSLREVVRACATTASRRAADMLQALRVAVAPTTVEALGKLAQAAFDDDSNSNNNNNNNNNTAATGVIANADGDGGALDVQLLCAELAMVLHHTHLDAAVASALDYLADAAAPCAACGLPRRAAAVCPVTSTAHLASHASLLRVLRTLAECAGSRELHALLIQQLRDAATQMRSSVHFLIYHICAHAGPHRTTAFMALEPYIRGTLMALVSADHNDNNNISNNNISSSSSVGRSATPALATAAARGSVSSEARASVLMLHVKLAALLSGSLDASYVQSIVRVLGTLTLRNHHDALALWSMGNALLRSCRRHLLELMPLDPRESRYGVDHAACAPESAACADNAQLVLRLLDRTHHFSAAMRKLVGCCVCRLVQDFNLQTPNLVGALLSTHGFVPVGLTPLSDLALPVGADSVFWTFWLRQLRRSAPARTALMAALARSVAQRFRVAAPAEAIALHECSSRSRDNGDGDVVAAAGGEATAHVFAVLVYEALKRNAALARVLLYMTTQWMRQSGHAPGKFVCLVYLCAQLVATVAARGAAPAAVEVEAETPHDRDVFVDATRRAAHALAAQQSRLAQLTPLVRRDNVVFARVVQRLQYKVQCTTALVHGTAPPPPPPPLDASDERDDTTAAATTTTTTTTKRTAAATAAAADAYAPYDDNVVFAPVDGIADATAASRTTAHHHDHDAHDHVGSRHDVDDDDKDAQATLAELQHAADDGVFDNYVDANVAPLDDDDGDENAAAASAVVVADDVSALSSSTTTTTSRRTHAAAAPPSGVDATASVPPPPPVATRNNNNNNNVIAHAAVASRHVDKAVSVPAERTIATSPITPWTALPQHDAHEQQQQQQHEEEAEQQQQQQQQQQYNDNDDNTHEAAVRVPVHTTWHEPDVTTLLMASTSDSDATPIACVDTPQLQAAHAHTATTALPSMLVLEYLRTHQGTDSLQHEMQQLNERWVQQQLRSVATTTSSSSSTTKVAAAPAALPQYAVQTVTVESRANNYDRPHVRGATALAPQSTRPQLVRMQYAAPATTNNNNSNRHGQDGGMAAAAGVAAPPLRLRSTAIVDGEQALEPMSAAPTTTTMTTTTTTIDGAVAAADVVATKRPRAAATAPTAAAADDNDDERDARVARITTTTTTWQRGAQYFLQHNRQLASAHDGHTHSAAAAALLREVHTNTTPVAAARAMAGGGGSGGGAVALARENLPPTTPYGQMVLPACFIEQTNDTALRELQQVMGGGEDGEHNARHDASPSSSIAAAAHAARRGRKSRHSGGSSGARRGDGEAGNDRSVTRSSAVWWAEMSAAPMPSYAADPQYSMELF